LKARYQKLSPQTYCVVPVYCFLKNRCYSLAFGVKLRALKRESDVEEELRDTKFEASSGTLEVKMFRTI
jgi:hypothetical protein